MVFLFVLSLILLRFEVAELAGGVDFDTWPCWWTSVEGYFFVFWRVSDRLRAACGVIPRQRQLRAADGDKRGYDNCELPSQPSQSPATSASASRTTSATVTTASAATTNLTVSVLVLSRHGNVFCCPVQRYLKRVRGFNVIALYKSTFTYLRTYS